MRRPPVAPGALRRPEEPWVNQLIPVTSVHVGVVSLFNMAFLPGSLEGGEKEI